MSVFLTRNNNFKKINDFLKEKATEFKIPVVSLDAKSNYMCHIPSTCGCVECQEFSHLTVSNSIIHPAEIFLLIEQAILALNIPEMTEQIQNFHQVECRQARNILASSILDAAIQYCTNSAEMQLTNASLLVFQYNFENKDVLIQ